MKFSASIEYAIHGLIYLANGPAGKTTLIADVAKAIETRRSCDNRTRRCR